MKAYNDGSNVNMNVKGGVIMKDSLRVEATTGFEYLTEIENIGAGFRIKTFSNLPTRMKDELICETFAKQFIHLCKAGRLYDFSFRIEGDRIKVKRDVKILIKGKNQKEEKISEETTVRSISLLMVPMAIDENSVKYSLELDPDEYNEEVLLQRVSVDTAVFATYQVYIPDSEKKVLKETSDIAFWKKMLPKNLLYKQEDSKLLVDFIDVLKAHRMTDATGSEIAYMKDIYHAAIKTFPLFRGMSRFEQVEILDNAYTRGYAIAKASRDIHLFAKATFEEMAKKDLYKILEMDGYVYTRVQEYRHNRIIDGKCYERNALKMVCYKYNIRGEEMLGTSFVPFELWHLMAVAAGARDDEYGVA